jgi:hypothetical protein
LLIRIDNILRTCKSVIGEWTLIAESENNLLTITMRTISDSINVNNIMENSNILEVNKLYSKARGYL